MTAPRFDAYTATTQALRAQEVLPWLMAEGCSVRQGRGFHTFEERASVVDGTGTERGSVSWGGRQGDRIMVEVKGEGTPAVVERLRAAAPGHRVTRVDSCIDVERPGAFAELHKHCLAVKQAHRLVGERRGDWEDHPELGRTQYLGSKVSVCQARLYEKGLQPELRHLLRADLVRLELQVRPVKVAKTHYAELSPVEVWGASKWTRDLAGRVFERELEAHPPGTVRGMADDEKKVRWMCRQYGSTLVGLAAELGGWDVLGLTLKEVIREERERAEDERRMLVGKRAVG